MNKSANVKQLGEDWLFISWGRSRLPGNQIIIQGTTDTGTGENHRGLTRVPVKIYGIRYRVCNKLFD